MEPEGGRIRVLAAVVRRGDRYLVAQRPTAKRHGGLWEFPGGKLEPGESTEDGLRRELREELGVRLERAGDHLLSVADPGSAFRIEFIEVSFAGEPQCLEHQRVAWMSVAELRGLDLAPVDRVFVERRLGG